MSHYQLLGPPGWTNNSASLTPHPDYFTSVLFKNLMGRRALHVQKQSAEPTASFHVWCSNGAAAPAGAVTLAYINPTGE